MKRKKGHKAVPKEDKVKLPYVFIREALEGETSVYQLSIFDKIKRLFTYLDTKSGRAEKRKQLAAKREQDLVSSLQTTATAFLEEKVYDKLKGTQNPDRSKEIEVQLDAKFEKVLPYLVSHDPTVKVRVRPVNQNYLKFTDKIPIRLEMKKKNNTDI